MQFATMPATGTVTKQGALVMRDGSCRPELVEVRSTTEQSRMRGASLRAERERLGLRLGPGARLLNLTPGQLSQVELGRDVFVQPSDYLAAREVWAKGELERCGMAPRPLPEAYPGHAPGCPYELGCGCAGECLGDCTPARDCSCGTAPVEHLPGCSYDCHCGSHMTCGSCDCGADKGK